MLQNHLSQCIATARTNCPDGYLETLTEENEEDTEITCNHNQINNSNYHSVVMADDDTLVSSNNDGPLNCSVKLRDELKTEIQMKKDY